MRINARAVERDGNGWSEAGRSSFNRFCTDRTDILDTERHGRFVYVFFSDGSDEVGEMDIVTGYWKWPKKSELMKGE